MTLVSNRRAVVILGMACACWAIFAAVPGRAQVAAPAVPGVPATPAAAAAALNTTLAGIEIGADDYQYQPDTGQAVGKGHVRVAYKDILITADELEANVNTKQLVARGHVTLKRGIFTWEGDEISGDLDTKDFTVGRYTAKTGEIYAKGTGGKHSGASGETRLSKVDFTTCEYIDHPHYRIHASSMTYYPDGHFTARNAVIKVGAVPVFWLPMVWGQAEAGGGVEIKPGYNGKWGAFLLFAKTWKINPNVDTKLRVDLRSKNGIALGNETRIKTETSTTDFLVYGMVDNNTPNTAPGYNRRFDTVDGRYRAKVYHQQSFLDEQNLNLRLRLDKLSDIDMLEDWFKKEYQADPQPKTFADLTLDSDRFSLSLSARTRVNDFYTETEELPKLKLDMPRQQIGDSGFYYQSQSSAADMKMKWRDFDLDRWDTTTLPFTQLADPADYSATRLDSVHMFYHPLQLGDLVQLVPRAGARLTWYSNSSKQKLSVADISRLIEVDDPDNPDSLTQIVNYDDKGGEVLRLAGEVGFEVSSKFYRTWSNYESKRWDIDGLRHVLQPYLNYTFAPDPTEDREHLYFFDEIDRLIEQNFVRLGLKQRWETRRSNRIYTLASLENYVDYHFNPAEDFDNPGDFGTKFTFNPKETLKFWGGTIVDTGTSELNRATLGTTFGNRNVCLVDLGYLYRNHYTSRTVYSMGSTLTDIAGDSAFAREYQRNDYATAQFTFPFYWQMEAVARYEYDLVANRLARQSYELRRDLHCWKGALRFEENDGDTAIMFMLYLKAFPGVGADASL